MARERRDRRAGSVGYEDVPITYAYHLGEPDDPGHQTHLFLDLSRPCDYPDARKRWSRAAL